MHKLKGIRLRETSFAIRMARIRACNMALYFFITPLVSFIVFTVVCMPWHTPLLMLLLHFFIFPPAAFCLLLLDCRCCACPGSVCCGGCHCSLCCQHARINPRPPTVFL